MTKAEAIGTVVGGKLKMSDKARANLDMDIACFKDCDVDIIVKKRGKRSSEQNRFYWGILIAEIRREFKRRGIHATSEDIHHSLKAKFNPARLADREGVQLLEIGGSTTEMNVSEFSGYLERIIQWCNESLEIIIPEPGTQTDLFNLNSAA